MTTNFSQISFVKLRDKIAFALWALLCCIFIFLPRNTLAQDVFEYDEISVYFNVMGIGGCEIPAAIYKEQVYLSITDIFDFLKIKNMSKLQFSSVKGFITREEETYDIDAVNYQIHYKDKRVNLKPTDLIRTASNLYLNSAYFGEIFALDCKFNFRSLSVKMETKLELPIIRQLRLQAMRKNRANLAGEIIPDTIIERNNYLFKLGMADWSILTNQEENGAHSERLYLALGAMLAGGETTIAINHTTNSKFSLAKQFYQWRYVNNKSNILRQFKLGKIGRQSIATINAPLLGVQVSNRPTNQTKKFGSYTLSDFTKPNWFVELYVNNSMVDYVKADASGFYSFEVPLLYGNTQVSLRFYGPWGEERSKEKNSNIPLSFLPENELQYSLQAGMLEDDENGRFAKATVNYGLGRSFTLGGGLEYLSSQTLRQQIPFARMSLNLGSGLLFSADYNHGLNFVGSLFYSGVSKLNLVLDYKRFVKDQIAIHTNSFEERKVSISFPIQNQYFSVYSRFAAKQIVCSTGKRTGLELMFSGSVLGSNVNLKTNAEFTDAAKLNASSCLSMSFNLASNFTFSPSLQYNYSNNELTNVSCALQKKIFKKAYVDFSYNYSLISKASTAQFGLRYDFSFGSTSALVRRVNNKSSFSQAARGSLRYDRATQFLGASKRTSVGKSGIVFVPFIDFNGNGSRDNGEPKAWGLKLRIKGCANVNMGRDTIIRVANLQAYKKYTVQIDPNSFDNIGWKSKQTILHIELSPNQFKRLELPVSVVGEVAGKLYHREADKRKGIGRIRVDFYNSDSIQVGSTLSEADGYFSYLGLSSGSYTAQVNSLQLEKLDMMATPALLPFTIKPCVDGDYVDGLELEIRSRDSLPAIAVAQKQNSFATKIVESKEKEACLIQIGEYNSKDKAFAIQKQLSKALGCSSVIVFEGDSFKLLFGIFESKKEAFLVVPQLEAFGCSDAQCILINDYVGADYTGVMNRSVFGVQLGAFGKLSNALAFQKHLAAFSDKKVMIECVEGFYKVQFNYFNGRKEARQFVLKLLDKGFSELLIVPVFRELSF